MFGHFNVLIRLSLQRVKFRTFSFVRNLNVRKFSQLMYALTTVSASKGMRVSASNAPINLKPVGGGGGAGHGVGI